VLAGTTGQMNILLVVLSASLGAIVGQAAGYALGWSIGFRLLRRYGRAVGLTDRRLAFGRALFTATA
jgi:membrane protein DedA with SNARE-associated domain